jgi:hypothetical protein
MMESPLADAPFVDDVLAWSDEQPAVEDDAIERLAERLAPDRVPNTGCAPRLAAR